MLFHIIYIIFISIKSHLLFLKLVLNNFFVFNFRKLDTKHNSFWKKIIFQNILFILNYYYLQKHHFERDLKNAP